MRPLRAQREQPNPRVLLTAARPQQKRRAFDRSPAPPPGGTRTGFVRRLRGTWGIGVTWAVLGATIGLVLGVIVGVVRPDQIEPGEGPGRIAWG